MNEETRTWVVIIESPFFFNKPVINGRLIDGVSIYERFARERLDVLFAWMMLDLILFCPDYEPGLFVENAWTRGPGCFPIKIDFVQICLYPAIFKNLAQIRPD